MTLMPSNTSFRVCKANLPEDESLSAVMTLATGESVTSEIRKETWLGREYTVVPVVAIVEGVLHGANAKGPEFASAEEFGKFPKAWDHRPVVMNHPQLKGVFVSAGIPEVLADYGMGYIFNSRVEDRKLKCEAWLDTARINELGGECLETLQRIENNEIVEVSVGAWLDVANKAGTFNGKTYVGVWQNVAPDHLAFLSKGTPGACSVKDGCGVPRLFSVNAAAIGSASSCCNGCLEGTGCEGDGHSHGPSASAGAEELIAAERAKAYAEELTTLIGEGIVFDDGLNINKVPSDMAFDDIKTIVWQGLLERLDMQPYDVDILACTSDAVVFYRWGHRGLNMLTFSINADGVIKFSTDETAVNLLTRIVPRQTTAPSVNTQENSMSDLATGAGSSTPAAPVTIEGNATVVVPTEVPTPTFEQLLAAAPANMRESFESGVRMLEARKNELVAGLIAVEANAFTEEELRAFSVDRLEKLAKLSGNSDFSGRAVPSEQPGINAAAGVDQGQKVSAAPTNYLAASA